MTVRLVVNDRDHEVAGDGRQSFLDALRDDLGVTGPKLGCGEGACGACTVLVGSRPVQACQVDVADVAGQRITTIVLGRPCSSRSTSPGGRILSASMTDYRVPRLADVPADIKVVLIDRPDQPSVGGGEAPIIAIAPASANAISRACWIRLRSMPLVPAGRVRR